LLLQHVTDKVVTTTYNETVFRELWKIVSGSLPAAGSDPAGAGTGAESTGRMDGASTVAACLGCRSCGGDVARGWDEFRGWGRLRTSLLPAKAWEFCFCSLPTTRQID